MHRRNILAAALASAGTLFSAARAHAAAPDATKVVYHLDDLDKVDFVLGNIANHYSGMGGPETRSSFMARRSRRSARRARRPT